MRNQHMKKQYITPAIQIMKLQQAQMLCASVPTGACNDLNNKPIIVYPNPMDGITNQTEMW